VCPLPTEARVDHFVRNSRHAEEGNTRAWDALALSTSPTLASESPTEADAMDSPESPLLHGAFSTSEVTHNVAQQIHMGRFNTQAAPLKLGSRGPHDMQSHYANPPSQIAAYTCCEANTEIRHRIPASFVEWEPGLQNSSTGEYAIPQGYSGMTIGAGGGANTATLNATTLSVHHWANCPPRNSIPVYTQVQPQGTPERVGERGTVDTDTLKGRSARLFQSPGDVTVDAQAAGSSLEEMKKAMRAAAAAGQLVTGDTADNNNSTRALAQWG